MKLHDIRPILRRHRRRRLGRGTGSGRGKTAGRGTKGQKARTGFNIPRRFEGGQTPLVQRLPKSGGFTSRSARYPIVPVVEINQHFKKGERVSPETLLGKGLLATPAPKVKLVGPGALAHFVRLENIVLTKRLASSLPPTPRPRPRKAAATKNSRPATRPPKNRRKPTNREKTHA